MANVLIGLRHPRSGWIEAKVRVFHDRCRSVAPAGQGLTAVALTPHVCPQALAVHPSNNWEMAVSCEDCFIRVYDRRKLGYSTLASQEAQAAAPVMSLAPPHMQLAGYRRNGRPTHSTFCSYGRRGSKASPPALCLRAICATTRMPSRCPVCCAAGGVLSRGPLLRIRHPGQRQGGRDIWQGSMRSGGRGGS